MLTPQRSIRQSIGTTDTRISVIAYTPIVAMFALFDFVVHNAGDIEAQRNVAYLDIVAGYFQRYGLVSENPKKSSLLARFTMYAKQYLQGSNETRQNGGTDADNEVDIVDIDTSPPAQKRLVSNVQVSVSLHIRRARSPRVRHSPSR